MGSGCIKKCPKCNYEYNSSTGVGFLFPLVYVETVQKAKAGDFGKELQEFFKEHEDGAISVEKVDLCCEDCGHLSGDFDLTMYIPNEKEPEKTGHGRWTVGMSFEDVDYVSPYDLDMFYKEYAKYPHRCEKCGGKMRIMKEDEQMICPKCKAPLETSDELCWD